MNNAIWTPQPQQIKFMERPEWEALYGGAAGGGKSDALLAEALRQVHIPHYRAIIFRKTNKQLSELVDRSIEIYKKAFPKARFNGSNLFWRFPSGAKIYFGNMQHTKDRLNYQGKRYDFIGFDELTHFTFEEYSYLFSRNRPGGPGTRCYIRATTNPGGIGHGWVKTRFITAAKPLETIWSKMKVASPDGKIIQLNRDRIFVPATIFDNSELLRNDPNYLASLATLPEKDRNALLYGDWNSFSGQVFTEFVDDSSHYMDRLHTHVVNPFLIPKHWRVYRAFDWGYSKPFSVGWYTVGDSGCIYRIRELYGSTSTPNEGVKWSVDKIAQKIKEIEEADPNLKGRRINGIADPAIFEKSTGISIAETMEKAGVRWERGDHKRLPGKMQYHYRLAFNKEGETMFQVFSSCKEFIRTIPTLVYSEINVEDVDTNTEDHIYDECRYMLMSNPIAPRINIPTANLILPGDPLNQRTIKYDKYHFMKIK